MIKNTKGKTVGYRLKSTDGIIIDIPEKKLKKKILKGEYKHIDFCYWDEDRLVGYGEIGYFYDSLGNN